MSVGSPCFLLLLLLHLHLFNLGKKNAFKFDIIPITGREDLLFSKKSLVNHYIEI